MSVFNTNTEVGAILELANNLTERDLNLLIDELVEMAVSKFGTCISVEDYIDKFGELIV